MFGEMRPYVLHYFLVDDSIEIREVHKPNDGHDPFPVLLRRQRLPKDRNNVDCKFFYCLTGNDFISWYVVLKLSWLIYLSYDLASFPMIVMELTDHEVKEWFTPEDFAIGKTLFIYGRRVLIYDCDEFTKK